MRPVRLVLENVGPFVGRREIDFRRLDDIFLITGKTGAGKTTIFDAICFALYGTLPGSRRGTGGRLRSDFAGEEDECLVVLDFDLGEKSYRIERSPKQERPKKRGIGTTVVDETAVLYELSAEGPSSLSGKKTEADEKLRQLVGLSGEEFSKIVLLPQGEFAEFLRQNSSERQEVLRKLFPVDLAVRVRELARSKEKDARARLEEAARTLGRYSDLGTDESRSRRNSAEEALGAAKSETARLTERMQVLAETLRLAEAEADAADRLGRAEFELGELEAQGETRAEWEKRLAASRRSRPLLPLALRSDTARREAESAGEALVLARTARAEAERRREELEKGKEAIAALDQEAAELRSRRSRLTEAAAEERELASAEAEGETLLSELEGLRAEAAAAETAERELETERSSLQGAAEGTEALDRRMEVLRKALEGLRSLKRSADDAAPLRRALGESEMRLKGTEAASAELAGRIPVLEAELEELERRRREEEEAGLAVKLAEGLRGGEPCPVCGSTEHPLPAAARAPHYGLKERSDALARSRSDAERELAARTAEGLSLRRELEQGRRELERYEERYRKELAELEEEGKDLGLFGALPRQLPAPAELSAKLQEASTAATETERERVAAARSRSRLAELYREAERLARRRLDLERELAAAAERSAEKGRSLAERRQRHERLLAEWRTDSVASALNSLETRLAEAAAAIEAHRSAQERAVSELSAATAREEAAAAAAEKTRGEAKTAGEAFQKALAEAGFRDAETLRSEALDEGSEAELEGRIAAWNDRRSSLAALGKELGRNLAELRLKLDAAGEGSTLEALREEDSGLAERRRQAEERRDAAAAALAAVEREEAEFQTARERHSALAEETRVLKTLSDDLSGNNPKKRSFDAWLLSLYLEEVAAYATRRLERMSEGRYSLLLDTEGEGAQGRKGLDLAIFDAYTGKTRPCGTLSGGESFMASISLALGLADSIQARSGGVRLDAVFIDEGFGSLDEASLDRALTILDEIRDHRMVGLISHVADMRSRIPSRIDVVKLPTGSALEVGKAEGLNR